MGLGAGRHATAVDRSSSSQRKDVKGVFSARKQLQNYSIMRNRTRLNYGRSCDCRGALPWQVAGANSRKEIRKGRLARNTLKAYGLSLGGEQKTINQYTHLAQAFLARSSFVRKQRWRVRDGRKRERRGSDRALPKKKSIAIYLLERSRFGKITAITCSVKQSKGRVSRQLM